MDKARGAGARRSFAFVAQGQPRISASLIDRYSAGPSANRSAAVKSLHESIRSALENWGDKNFDTFLQGSYRNGTDIADINDVDIVALYDPWSSLETHARWEWLFNHVADIHALACEAMGLRHLRTRPYRPAPTAKPSASSAPCWAAGPTARSTAQAANAPQPLTGWLWTYNHRRPHGALSHKPPITRLNELNNLAGSYS